MFLLIRSARILLFFVYGIIVGSLCVYLGMVAAAYPRVSFSLQTTPPMPVALVLGASVNSKGILSPVMQERADKAIQLYRVGIVKKIIVSGDDSTLQYDEVYPVGKYLRAYGVPQRDIFLDYAGFDTYSSVYRAKHVFHADAVLIVTQWFHLPRALFIAWALGMEARGVDASKGERYIQSTLREIPASVKALFEVLFGRLPKYLGTPFPVAGKSDETWLGAATEDIYFLH